MGKGQSLSRYVDFLLCSSPLGLKLSPFFFLLHVCQPPSTRIILSGQHTNFSSFSSQQWRQMKSREVLNSVCLSTFSRSTNIRTLNGIRSIRNKIVKTPSYIMGIDILADFSLLLQMSSLKICAKIVMKSCRILFKSSTKPGEISARNVGDFKCFRETNKFIATCMYTHVAANGAALTDLVTSSRQLFHSKI